MSNLRASQIRLALCEALRVGFGDGQGNVAANVLPWPIGATDFPAVVMAPGEPWLSRTEEGSNTFCTHVLRLRILLLAGKPNEEGTWEALEFMTMQLQDVLDQVHRHELWDGRDGIPFVEFSVTSENSSFNKVPVLASLAEVVIPFHK